MMHGKGVYQWPDGRKYEGEYFCNCKHGWGVFKWSNGTRYQGPWLNGKRHGKGQYFVPSGNSRYGIWHLDKRVQWISETISSSSVKKPKQRGVLSK